MDIPNPATSTPPTGLPPTPPGWDWSKKGHLTRKFGKLRLTIVENRMRPGAWTISLSSGAGAHFHTPDGFKHTSFALSDLGGLEPQEDRFAEVMAIVRTQVRK